MRDDNAPTRWTGVWAPVAAGLLWTMLAVRTPTNTFHFAPIVVVVSWPVFRSVGGGAASRWDLLSVTVAGTVLAVLVGVGLAATGNLEGPTFWSDGGALIEVVVFAVATAVVVGLVSGRRTRPRPS